ncbi:MAG TPA: M10 family metallopeptidase C-terminal domain-containing protein, partial [Edaphobacter sp.]|nr:M10 family metallopeptidase C-terminal domain-containing protein [Edaphobacter sp.]
MAAGTKIIPLSGNSDIDALVQNDFNSSGVITTVWNTGNLTFSFPGSASFYNYSGTGSNEPSQTFQAVSTEVFGLLPDAVELAFDRYRHFANLTFTEITETSSAHAEIRLAIADLTANRGYFPGDPSVQSGDVWLSASESWADNSLDTGNSFGTHRFMTVMHEIGHALGLTHPGFGMDPSHVGWDYTIMSYQSFPTAPSTFSGEGPTTPMLADVAAIQYMYGANFSTNAGDTIYRWSPNSGQLFLNGQADVNLTSGGPNNKIYMTLWDGGGNDTYDFSNYGSDVRADLRPGEWSSPSQTQVAVLSASGDPVVTARGSIANAYLHNGDTRSLIENAIGGSGNDTLIGNQGSNVLTGNAGDDIFFYTGGSDKFHGNARGTTGDTADFSLSSVGVVIAPVASTSSFRLPNGQLLTIAISDFSTLADNLGNAYDASYFNEIGLTRVVGMHGIENITGSPLADTITGNLGDNIIRAGSGADLVFYKGGFDTIEGGAGTDTISFAQFNSAVAATLVSLNGFAEAFTSDTASILPNSTLRSIADLAGFEKLTGTSFNDALHGNSSDNTLDGGSGNDSLFYNGGLDVLNGNTGSDTADFSQNGSSVLVDLAGGGFEARSNGTSNAGTGDNIKIADLQSIENLTGSIFDDILRGDSGGNIIDGGKGADILDGRGGNDNLKGGAGNDAYDFGGQSGTTGADRIFDDSGIDKLFINRFLGLSASRDGNDIVVTLPT